ncbi:MAG: ester cyclase [Candidatus Protistobacter heckmanni]|nr:ester cyclase [Candidatus Protistobacter heckmanni]
MDSTSKLAAAAAFTVISASAVSAQTLTQEEALKVITPWYSQFNLPVQGDVKTIQETIVSPDYQSCTGDGPGECWNRDTSIKVVGSFAKTVPDMKFAIKEMFIIGERVIVRGEVSGTPAVPLYGGLIPHSGKSFKVMTIDIQTIRDGKLVKTYHMENWFAALVQLRAN